MELQWVVMGYAVLVIGRFFFRVLRDYLQEWMLRTEPTPQSWEDDLRLAQRPLFPHARKTPPPHR